MVTPARTGVSSAAAGWTRAAAWAPEWRSALSRALAHEVEERRFFLWSPGTVIGGVALNLAADREPVMWLPALMTVLFAALAWFSRARPLALGLSLAIAALFAGFLSMSLRTARVAAPVLDRIRIVSLQGFVEEVDLGAVASPLGPIQHLPSPGDASWRQRFDAAIDQARNRLALRVNAIIGGDEGAIAAAMVTGKRDFLSNDARDLIREAGIFHIIT